MSGRRIFYDLPFKSYEHHKRPKNRLFSCFLMNFAHFQRFVMLITFEQKVVENAATTHFVQNFVLFKIALLKNSSNKVFQNLKTTVFGFLETLPSYYTYEILVYNALYRKFH